MFVIHVVQVVKAKKVKKKDVKTIVSYNFFVVMGGCTKVKKIKVASVFWGALKYTIGVVVTSLRSAKQMYERRKNEKEKKGIRATKL